MLVLLGSSLIIRTPRKGVNSHFSQLWKVVSVATNQLLCDHDGFLGAHLDA